MSNTSQRLLSRIRQCQYMSNTGVSKTGTGVSNTGVSNSRIIRNPTINEVEASIIENLNCLFQIRQNNALSAPLCGIPDFSLVFQKYVNPSTKLCHAIKKMIEQFEPRLINVTVKRLEDTVDLNLYFEISAMIQIDNQHIPFRAESVMSSPSHIEISH